MFDQKFRVILYEIFIQSSLEFCSTLFFDLKSISETDRLDKCFYVTVNKYLNIKLCKTIKEIKKCAPLKLTEQASILSKFEILPRRLRAFYYLLM